MYLAGDELDDFTCANIDVRDQLRCLVVTNILGVSVAKLAIGIVAPAAHRTALDKHAGVETGRGDINDLLVKLHGAGANR